MHYYCILISTIVFLQRHLGRYFIADGSDTVLPSKSGIGSSPRIASVTQDSQDSSTPLVSQILSMTRQYRARVDEDLLNSDIVSSPSSSSARPLSNDFEPFVGEELDDNTGIGYSIDRTAAIGDDVAGGICPPHVDEMMAIVHTFRLQRAEASRVTNGQIFRSLGLAATVANTVAVDGTLENGTSLSSSSSAVVRKRPRQDYSSLRS